MMQREAMLSKCLDVASDFPLWSVTEDGKKKIQFSFNLRCDIHAESLGAL